MRDRQIASNVKQRQSLQKKLTPQKSGAVYFTLLAKIGSPAGSLKTCGKSILLETS